MKNSKNILSAGNFLRMGLHLFSLQGILAPAAFAKSFETKSTAVCLPNPAVLMETNPPVTLASDHAFYHHQNFTDLQQLQKPRVATFQKLLIDWESHVFSPAIVSEYQRAFDSFSPVTIANNQQLMRTAISTSNTYVIQQLLVHGFAMYSSKELLRCFKENNYAAFEIFLRHHFNPDHYKNSEQRKIEFIDQLNEKIRHSENAHNLDFLMRLASSPVSNVFLQSLTTHPTGTLAVRRLNRVLIDMNVARLNTTDKALFYMKENVDLAVYILLVLYVVFFSRLPAILNENSDALIQLLSKNSGTNPPKKKTEPTAPPKKKKQQPPKPIDPLKSFIAEKQQEKKTYAYLANNYLAALANKLSHLFQQKSVIPTTSPDPSVSLANAEQTDKKKKKKRYPVETVEHRQNRLTKSTFINESFVIVPGRAEEEPVPISRPELAVSYDDELGEVSQVDTQPRSTVASPTADVPPTNAVPNQAIVTISKITNHLPLPTYPINRCNLPAEAVTIYNMLIADNNGYQHTFLVGSTVAGVLQQQAGLIAALSPHTNLDFVTNCPPTKIIQAYPDAIRFNDGSTIKITLNQREIYIRQNPLFNSANKTEILMFASSLCPSTIDAFYAELIDDVWCIYDVTARSYRDLMNGVIDTVIDPYITLQAEPYLVYRTLFTFIEKNLCLDKNVYNAIASYQYYLTNIPADKLNNFAIKLLASTRKEEIWSTLMMFNLSNYLLANLTGLPRHNIHELHQQICHSINATINEQRIQSDILYRDMIRQQKFQEILLTQRVTQQLAAFGIFSTQCESAEQTCDTVMTATNLFQNQCGK